jgi:lipopolysaccharide/colanic/teichoic acid biosynthesis glycosyltransferase
VPERPAKDDTLHVSAHREVTASLDTKRAMDLVVGAPALVVVAPALVGIAVAMRVAGDHGPFLYRARRVGEGGRIISVLKIRTMAGGPDGPRLTSVRDPRVTRVGRVLRRYRLDELPQLANVVRGDMSLVGPRPEDPAFVDLSEPDHRRVFTAKPGITGLAQLAFHDEAALLSGPDAERRYRQEILPAKLRLDVDYLDRRSTWLDIQILIRTVRTVFGGRPGTGRPPG